MALDITNAPTSSDFESAQVSPNEFVDPLRDSFQDGDVKQVRVDDTATPAALTSALRRAATRLGLGVKIRKYDSAGNRTREDANAVFVRFMGTEARSYNKSSK